MTNIAPVSPEPTPEKLIEILKNEIWLRDTEIQRLDQEIKNLKRDIDFVIVDGMAFRSFTLIYKDEK